MVKVRLHNQPNLFAGESPSWNFEERTIVALICNQTISPSRSHPLHQELNMCRKIRRRILNVIITITTITGCTQIPISTLSHIWVFVRLYGIVFAIIVIIIIITIIIKSEGVNAQL